MNAHEYIYKSSFLMLKINFMALQVLKACTVKSTARKRLFGVFPISVLKH